jgi:hypothetical protein
MWRALGELKGMKRREIGKLREIWQFQSLSDDKSTYIVVDLLLLAADRCVD